MMTTDTAFPLHTEARRMCTDDRLRANPNPNLSFHRPPTCFRLAVSAFSITLPRRWISCASLRAARRMFSISAVFSLSTV